MRIVNKMKKDLAIIFGLFLVIVALLAFGGSGLTSVSFVGGRSSQTDNSGPSTRSKDSITIGARTMIIEAKVADKADERKKGLSGLDSLPLNQGMLFVFETKGNYVFWMKDVKFAIDIIWIDENKKVVDIAQNVAPEPKKDDNDLTLYRPRAEAMYVLETNAGLSTLHGLQIGDQVSFEL